MRDYTTNLGNKKKQQLADTQKLKTKSELDQTFLLFAKSTENKFIERGHIEEVMASCDAEMSASCYHHLKMSFKVYFKIFLKLCDKTVR